MIQRAATSAFVLLVFAQASHGQLLGRPEPSPGSSLEWQLDSHVAGQEIFAAGDQQNDLRSDRWLLIYRPGRGWKPMRRIDLHRNVPGVWTKFRVIPLSAATSTWYPSRERAEFQVEAERRYLLANPQDRDKARQVRR